MEENKEAINKELKLLSKDIRDVAREKNKVTANNIIKVLPDQAKFINSNSPEVLMAGGIASGKSVALCLSLIQKALVPGAVCILTRKTLTDLKASTLRLLLESEGTRPPLLPKGTYEWNKTDRIIEIRGGGIIYYTGCDDPMKIRSINASDIFIDEVSQLDENEFNELKMRLRVNVGSLQIKAVTNPANKSHWLYKRFVLNKSPEREMIYANSLNNIYLPKRTLDHLHNLKGETFDKMVLGQWLSQEKIIYKQFNPQHHVKDFNWIEISKDFEDFFISIDVGWTNASALLLVGLHKNGKIYICDEFEKPNQLIGKLGYQLSRWIKDCRDANIICDPAAAQVINELCAKGYNVKKAPNEVNSGISLVQSAFEENVLVISSSCTNLIREIEGYSRDDFGKIIKEDDHLCFDGDTLVKTINGDIKIKDINIGDEVLTRFGKAKVVDKALTKENAEVNEYSYDGKTIIATPNHPILTNNGFIPIDKTDNCCIIKYLNESGIKNNKLLGEKIWKKTELLLNRLNTMELSLEDIHNLKIHQIQDTISPMDLEEIQNIFIDIYGKNITDLFQKDIRYITLMEIILITILTILWQLQYETIWQDIGAKKDLQKLENVCYQLIILLKNGIVAKKEENGIENMLELLQKNNQLLKLSRYVNNVEKSLRFYQWLKIVQNFVQIIAKLKVEENQVLTILLDIAKHVEKSLLLISMLKNNIVVENVPIVKIRSLNRDVYNITTTNHEYIANDIISHNCDALRYNISYLSLRGASQLKEIASFALPDIGDTPIVTRKDEEWSNIYE